MEKKNTLYMREYMKTPNGKKRGRFKNWKRQGLIGNYDEIYERFIKTEKCDLCNLEFIEGHKGKYKKCMDHNHETGLFRNVVCNGCNSSKTDRKKQINSTSGYKNISFIKRKKLWVYEKEFRGRKIKITRKDKSLILAIKFCGLLLYRY